MIEDKKQGIPIPLAARQISQHPVVVLRTVYPKVKVMQLRT